MSASLRASIDRVRRATRNADILDICDFAETTLNAANSLTASNKPVSNKSNGKFDKKTYQRDLMRKRRADDKLRALKEA